MEEKIPSKNVSAMKKNCDKHTEEIKVTEKCRPVPLKKEKAYEVKLQNSVQNLIANKEQDSGRCQSVKTNKNRVLKRKMTENGVTIESVLSEGEASSGFETVSSINSDLDLKDFQLSSSDDESDYNVIVRIENELAYRQSKNSGGRKHSLPLRSSGEIRYNSKSERLLCNYSGQRHGIVRSYKQSLHWRRLSSDAFQRYDWTDSWSRADDDSQHSRRTSDREWSRSSGCSIVSRENRCVDQSKRYRGSLHTDYITEKSKKKKTAIHRETSEPKYELIGSKSLSYEIVKKESKHSTSFEKSKSSTKRILQSTKQNISSSSPKSSSKSIWKRLDGGKPRQKLKMDEIRSSGSPSANKPRKKERTPFLVELERKLKKTEKQPSVKVPDSDKSDQNKTQNFVTETAPGPEVATMNAASAECLNLNYVRTSSYTYPSYNPLLYSTQYVPFPTLSMENLPLVPSPSGLPVHITQTGEHIFHDMDGRRIPIGPHGYYLPLDSTGRLYPHFVSPGTQPVAIHMTEDGVLRLPNGQPVPFGLPNHLAVNIDGSIIYIGPDSRPLSHYPNFPTQPSVHAVQRTQYNVFGSGQTEIQGEASSMPQICQTGNEQTPEIQGETSTVPQICGKEQTPEIQGGLAGQYSSFQSLGSDLLNSWEKTNREDIVKNYHRRVRQRQENVLKCVEIKKNLEVGPSEGTVKSSIFVKLSQKRTRDEYDGDSISTDSSESKPEGDLKSLSEENKDKKQCTESKREDILVAKIRKVLKSLDENKFKPPALGRFIIPEVVMDIFRETSPNVSPLMKNRVKLPFITPNFNKFQTPRNESETTEKPPVIFSFLSREKSSDPGENLGQTIRKNIKDFHRAKLPVVTSDTAVQCDLTSNEISKLNTKIGEMEKEVSRLQSINASLLDGFKHIQEANLKKSGELSKALLDIEKKNSEILTLKCLLNEK